MKANLLGVLLGACAALTPWPQQAIAQTTVFERSGGRESFTMREMNQFYKSLDSSYNTISMHKIGAADGGAPLHVIYYCADGTTDPAQWKEEGKIIILINNNIHPGEPDGVDATAMMLRDAAEQKFKIPKNIGLAIIPMYNLGGAANRGRISRANQNGPLAYGFRGNAKNLDLNRDFIKCDANETKCFERLFTKLDPEVLIDNHVSDGADYQHLMSLLTTQHDKLGGAVGQLLHNTYTPKLYKDMKKLGYDLVPYVNIFNNTPEHGWTAFYEPPRFASGYAALFQTISFVPETHMLKPFKQRVYATYDMMQCIIIEASKMANDIKHARATDRKNLMEQKEFPLDWKPDTTKYEKITFKGYQSGYKTSEISGQPRLYYDHNKPYTKQLKFYHHYTPTLHATAPYAYIVPKAWKEVWSRLKQNGVTLQKLAKPTTMDVTTYTIDHYETTQKPYESHYMHRNVQISKKSITKTFEAGDFIVYVNQNAKRYLVETLEPNGPDAFFVWNFFDGILQQKEGYSDYVFEDLAVNILDNDPALKAKFLAKKMRDTAFARNGNAQLDYIYKNSPYMEPEYMRYPIYRLEY